MSNSLDPDQARRFIGPDLGPNCLPRLSADDTGRQRVISGYFAILSSSWNVFAAIYYRGVMHNWNMREKYTAAFKFSSIDNDFWLIHLQNRTEQNRTEV